MTWKRSPPFPYEVWPPGRQQRAALREAARNDSAIVTTPSAREGQNVSAETSEAELGAGAGRGAQGGAAAGSACAACPSRARSTARRTRSASSGSSTISSLTRPFGRILLLTDRS